MPSTFLLFLGVGGKERRGIRPFTRQQPLLAYFPVASMACCAGRGRSRRWRTRAPQGTVGSSGREWGGWRRGGGGRLFSRGLELARSLLSPRRAAGRRNGGDGSRSSCSLFCYPFSYTLVWQTLYCTKSYAIQNAEAAAPGKREPKKEASGSEQHRGWTAVLLAFLLPTGCCESLAGQSSWLHPSQRFALHWIVPTQLKITLPGNKRC